MLPFPIMKLTLPTSCATLAILFAPLALHAEPRVEWIKKNVEAELEKESKSKSSSSKKKSKPDGPPSNQKKPDHPPGPGGPPDKKSPPKPPSNDRDNDRDNDRGKSRPDDRNRSDDYRRDDVRRGGGPSYYPPAPIPGYPRYYGAPGWGGPSPTIIRTPAYSTRYVYSRGDAGSDLGYAVQRALAKRGYPIGPIDGVIGSRTRAALADFQDRSGIPPTGRIDEPTLRALDLVSYR